MINYGFITCYARRPPQVGRSLVILPPWLTSADFSRRLLKLLVPLGCTESRRREAVGLFQHSPTHMLFGHDN